MSLEALNHAVFRRCWKAHTEIWRITEKCGWIFCPFAHTTSMVHENFIPTLERLQDLALELNLDVKNLKEDAGPMSFRGARVYVYVALPL
jgi:hypothetical protein